MNRLSDLSLCMIVKNEADNLTRFLPRMISWMGETVIVDTGSSDGTVDIARELGCTVYQIEWQDDFAAARNFALDQAQGTWILMLDADELLQPTDFERLSEHLQNPRVDAWNLEIRTYQNTRTRDWYPTMDVPPEASGCHGYLRTYLTRLFRKSPEIRYSGRIHETIEPSLVKNHYRTETGQAVIHHFGRILTTEDQLRKKQQFYERLGRKKQADQVGDPVAAYELALQLYENEKYAEAIACFQQASQGLPTNPEIQIDYALCLAHRGRLAEGIQVLVQSTEMSPTHAETWFQLGSLRLAAGKYLEAIESFKKSREYGYHPVMVSLSLGVAHANLGQNQESVNALQEVVEQDPENATAWAILGSVLGKQRQWQKARQALGRAIEIAPNYPDAYLYAGNVEADQGHFREALPYFQKVLELCPGDPRAIHNLALAHQKLAEAK